MIEPEDVDRLVERMKPGELTWRPTGNGDATAEDSPFYRWTLLADNATLCRVGLNPHAVEHGGLRRSSERYIATVLAPVVNAMLLPAVPTPVRAPRRRRRDSSPAAIDPAAKLGSVEESQLQLMDTPTRRGDPA